MSRCRSWRPTERQHAPVHLPGQCFDCWQPCFQRVPRGTSMCPGCTEAMTSSPNPTIRLAVVESPQVSESTLRTLAADLDAMVAYAAQWALERRAARPSRRDRPSQQAPAGPDRRTSQDTTSTPPSVASMTETNTSPAPDPWAGWTDGR